MSDEIEDIPVETVVGRRSGGQAGEGLIIGLALLALAGGVLIALGNLLSTFSPDAVAATSPTPRGEATPTPTPTPRPTRTPRPLAEVAVEPRTDLPPPVEYPMSTTAWMRAMEEIPIRRIADSGSEEIGRLAAGGIVIVEVSDAAPGWVRIVEPIPPGYVQLEDAGGRPVAELYSIDSRHGGWIQGLQAGPQGYLALVQPSGSDQRPSSLLVLSSSDGARWGRVDDLVGPSVWNVSVAWGPSGWLAAVNYDAATGPTAWLWESADGEHWSLIGTLPFAGQRFIQQLVGSDAGYLLSTSSGSSSDLWYSADGLLWQESTSPFEDAVADRLRDRGAPPHMLATPQGFVVWVGGEDYEELEPAVAFSSNGRTWAEVPFDRDPPRRSLRLATAGARLLAVGMESSGAVRVFAADLSPGGQPRLERRPLLEVALDGTRVWTMASDGDRVYVFGSVRAGREQRAWMGDGGQWQRLSLPPGDSGYPVAVAARPDGMVLASATPTIMGQETALWRRTANGSWSREQLGAEMDLPTPTPEECGPVPDDVLEFIAMDPSTAAACLGDTPVSFTAFSFDCEWCDSGSAPPRDGARWLREYGNRLMLQPFASEREIGWWREVVLHPSVGWDDAWRGSWVQLTGSYHHSASDECGDVEDDDLFGWGFRDREEMVFHCRRQFVVTSIEVVDGPESG